MMTWRMTVVTGISKIEADEIAIKNYFRWLTLWELARPTPPLPFSSVLLNA